MKTESYRVKDVDWTKILTKEQMKAINFILSIIRSNPQAYVRYERASEELVMPEVDEPKDPYMFLHNPKDNIEIISDGTITYGDLYGDGSAYYRPTTVSKYNYIIEKTKDTNGKIINLSIIVKTYPMKIYLMLEANKPRQI